MSGGLAGVALTLAVLLLAACGGPDEPAGTNTAGSGVTTASVQDCGTVTLAAGESFPDAPAQCLTSAAAARREAQLRATVPGADGTAVPLTYLSRPDGSVEVRTKGADGVVDQVCVGPSSSPTGLLFASCEDSN